AQLRTSGISLLEPSLTIYDGYLRPLGSASATSPLAGDLSVAFTNSLPGQEYYLKVSGATRSVFGIGSYQLGLSTQTGTRLPDPFPNNVDNRMNDTFATATRLTPKNSSFTTLDFSYRAGLGTAGDVDYYRVHSPGTTGNVPIPELIAMVS